MQAIQKNNGSLRIDIGSRVKVSQNVTMSCRGMPGEPTNDAGFLSSGAVDKDRRLADGSPRSADIGSSLNRRFI